MPEKKESTTFNSKMIVTLTGVASITVMACFDVLTGNVALPAIIGLVAGYVGYRQITKK